MGKNLPILREKKMGKFWENTENIPKFSHDFSSAGLNNFLSLK